VSAPGAAGTTGFFQDGPQLGNQYDGDALLRQTLARMLPADVMADVEPDLSRFGGRVVTDVLGMARDAQANPPQLVQYDAWGRRTDHIETSLGWRALKGVAAEEGIVAIGYERAHGAFSRLHQMAKLYLFNPSSAVYSCPLAMTDGAARLLERADSVARERAYDRLTTRDRARFWTSGQWMTERAGGSDVGRTGTVARAESGLPRGATHRLRGTKWFTSATNSEMAMTLARVEDANGETRAGSRGLSLFYVETRDAAGALADIEVLRLKDKLGTRALPTAELELRGTPATLVGEPGRGVPTIATLINVTRLYNTICAVSNMRRGLALARDYAHRRHVFGRPLAEQPLHLETLAGLEVELQGATALAFHCVGLLGREDVGEATADEAAELRLLTPLAKLYTARQSVAASSEILESFGGAGYVEDTGLPALLRDSQVLSIWEGTTNVLSLDTLRAIQREDALRPSLERALQRCVAAAKAAPVLAASADRVASSVGLAAEYLPVAFADGMDALQAGARRYAYGLTRVLTGSLLLEHAAWAATTLGDGRSVAAAKRWCAQDLAPYFLADADHRAASRALALG